MSDKIDRMWARMEARLNPSPLVSVICPTYNRAERHEAMYGWFAGQTYPNLELLVYDDSPKPSDFLEHVKKNTRSRQSDPRVTVIYSPSIRKTIGAKRNALIAQARGEIIVHFDDDDLYYPEYVETMVSRLANFDFIKLSVWNCIREFDGSIWEVTGQPNWIFTGKDAAPYKGSVDSAFLESLMWGYGFSYVFRKRIWRVAPFADVSWGEDFTFYQGIRRGARCGLVADAAQHVLHTVHPKSTSRTVANRRLR